MSKQQLHSALNECGIDLGTLWRIQDPSRLGRGQTTSHASALFGLADEYARRSKRDSCQCDRQPISAGRVRMARIRPVWAGLTNIVCPLAKIPTPYLTRLDTMSLLLRVCLLGT